MPHYFFYYPPYSVITAYNSSTLSLFSFSLHPVKISIIMKRIRSSSAEGEVEKYRGLFTSPSTAKATSDKVIQITKSSEKRGLALQSRIKGLSMPRDGHKISQRLF